MVAWREHLKAVCWDCKWVVPKVSMKVDHLVVRLVERLGNWLVGDLVQRWVEQMAKLLADLLVVQWVFRLAD